MFAAYILLCDADILSDALSFTVYALSVSSLFTLSTSQLFTFQFCRTALSDRNRVC